MTRNNPFVNGNPKVVYLQSQILESKDALYMENLVEILNENTDNGCFYELITVKNYNKKK